MKIIKQISVILLYLIINTNADAQINKNHKLLINNKFEKIDSKLVKEAIANGYKGLRSDGKIEFLSYRYKKEGDKNILFIYGSQEEGFSVNEIIKNTFFAIHKEYNSKGNIIKKGGYYNNADKYDGRFGIWYHFDDNGKLIYKINYDEGYDFSYDKVLKYCKSKGIKILKNNSTDDIYPSAKKYYILGKKVWAIYIPNDEPPKGARPNEILTPSICKVAFYLDGNTGIISIIVVLLARLISIQLPIYLIPFKEKFTKGTIAILVWGGLRGGVSIALALSLPEETGEYKNIILSITYTMVVFSILVQGMTIGSIAKKI